MAGVGEGRGAPRHGPALGAAAGSFSFSSFGFFAAGSSVLEAPLPSRSFCVGKQGGSARNASSCWHPPPSAKPLSRRPPAPGTAWRARLRGAGGGRGYLILGLELLDLVLQRAQLVALLAS